MQEMTNPTPVEWDRTQSITGILKEKLAADPSRPQWERKSSIGSDWIPVSVAQFVEEVQAVAAGLIASGVQKGDRVGIMSRTRYEWTLVDFASWWAGAVPVPIYETSSAEQALYIGQEAELTMVFVETHAQALIAEGLKEKVPSVREVFVFDDGAIGELTERGQSVDPAIVAEREESVVGDDVATIIFTSGTTGRPKGVVLHHSNFVFLTHSGRIGFHDVCNKDTSRTLLFLPLAHVFARFIEVLCVATPTVAGHSPDTKNLIADVGTFKPTYILAVPRLFEKIFNSADAKAGSGAKLKIFRWSTKVAIEYSKALEQPGGPSAALKAQHAIASRLVLGKIMELLGGNVEYVVSGGAALGDRLGHFFRGVGIKILEGYGLTETTAPVTCNLPDRTKIGTIGVPFPQAAVRISDTGEIETKGDHVFHGYWKNDAATADAFNDGWFKTGDLGGIDDDGYVTITGRAKDIIVTAGGKNVAPAVLEDGLRGHPIVSQVLVVGDGKPFIGALVTLDAEMLPGWLENHGLPPMTVAQARNDERVLAAIDRAVTRTNEAVSRAESIRKFTVLGEDFTEQNGLLTPSLKVKRGATEARYADTIAELYGEK
ncbi:long-chain acyl-CoA synthetase [Ruaniaceae bacterium KH17]|nr:long-chain acyl-CoA synthetase [Ruaniaceae bacterium KH17]